MSAIDDAMNTEQHAAYREWVRLRNIAEQTKTVDDCIASGKAFASFHYLFVENTFRPSSKVIPFPRRYPDFGGAA